MAVDDRIGFSVRPIVAVFVVTEDGMVISNGSGLLAGVSVGVSVVTEAGMLVCNGSGLLTVSVGPGALGGVGEDTVSTKIVTCSLTALSPHAISMALTATRAVTPNNVRAIRSALFIGNIIGKTRITGEDCIDFSFSQLLQDDIALLHYHSNVMQS